MHSACFLSLYFNYLKYDMARETRQDLDFFCFTYFFSAKWLFSQVSLSWLTLHGSEKWDSILNLAAKNQRTTPKEWQSVMEALCSGLKNASTFCEINQCVVAPNQMPSFQSDWTLFQIYGEERKSRGLEKIQTSSSALNVFKNILFCCSVQ